MSVAARGLNLTAIELGIPSGRHFYFEIPGEPVAWERSGVHGRKHFTRKKPADARDTILWTLRATYPNVTPQPETMFGMRLAFYSDDFTRRDVDNCVKLILDALQDHNGVGLWQNDRQVKEVYSVMLPARPTIPSSAKTVILAYHLSPQWLQEMSS